MICDNCIYADDKYNECYCENLMFDADNNCLSRIDIELFNKIYNKAIDDFLFQIKKNNTIMLNNDELAYYYEDAIGILKCEELAEQLKKGEKND